MRESCSCGAAIHTLFYRRAVTWRLTHHHGELHDYQSDTQIADPQPIGFAIPAEEEED